jgi:ribosomal protein L17
MKLTRNLLRSLINEELEKSSKKIRGMQQVMDEAVNLTKAASVENDILNALQQLYPDDPLAKKYFLNGLLNKVG